MKNTITGVLVMKSSVNLVPTFTLTLLSVPRKFNPIESQLKKTCWFFRHAQ